MEAFGLSPAEKESPVAQLLALLADPAATKARVEELAKATTGYEKAVAEYKEMLERATEAHERADKLSHHVEFRHKGLDQRESECRRLKVANELREAKLKEGEAQLNARRQNIEAALGLREGAVQNRSQALTQREQAVEDRENAVSLLKAKLDEREERLKKAMG